MKDRVISIVYFTLSTAWVCGCVWIIAGTR